MTDAVVPATPGALFVNLLGNFETTYGAQLIGCTAVRIRGVIKYDHAGAGDVSAVTAIRVVDDQEVATLTGARGPLLDLYADWMMFEPTIRSGLTEDEHVFDVQSSRKIEELGQGLYVAIQSTSVALTYQGVFSVGLKLP